MSRRSQKSQKSFTQQTLDECFEENNLNFDEQANDVVRYIILRAGEKITFTKADIQKHIIPKCGRYFEEIMSRVRKILHEVYGYNLLLIDPEHKKSKSYIVSSSMSYEKDPHEQENEVPEDRNKILLMLILTHIFMSNNESTDASLFAFLKSLGLDVEIRHEIFGNIKEYINDLIKLHYVNSQVDSLSKKHTYAWGHRAEKEISKHALLKFVCKMYRDRLPKSWVNQYKLASAQAFENNKSENNESMEVE